MTAIWAATAQSCMIAIAYTAACLAAGAFAVVAILNLTPADLSGDPGTVIEFTILALSTAFSAFVSAFWPAVIAIAITEGLKLRGLVAYALAGAAVGLASAFHTGVMLNGGDTMMVTMRSAELSVACGAIGGFVYWMIAGRTAGYWLELNWFDPHRR
ncbi:hypothetical protein [Acuticoccus mangrovi]|uniref:Uncharacterized protein n=1 Tax=Acuticoccus mangrovi TaxID=2796142 RepID=A0A934IRI9_9HYPH|nr:hypothetical protein [Acuticoccus mangrovi]MBJ3777323.1 hypothetical protein [Acuticoccus mangrovi]